jgi:hypothetical protein
MNLSDIKRAINSSRKANIVSSSQADDGIVHISVIAGYATVEASFPPEADNVSDLLDVIECLAVDAAITWKVPGWIKIR